MKGLPRGPGRPPEPVPTCLALHVRGLVRRAGATHAGAAEAGLGARGVGDGWR